MSKRSHQKRKERKKKKRSRSGGRSVSTALSPAAAPATAEEEQHRGLDIPDEILHAPRETSKLRFALMIGLVIFLLIIFIVPSAMLGVAGGGGNDPTYLSFTGVDGQRIEISGVDFYQDLRAFTDAFTIDSLAAFPLGVSGRAELDDKTMARILVLEHLARGAGVHFPRQDLAEHIQQVNRFRGTSTDAYRAILQRFGGPERIESTLQRALTVSRYLQLAGHAGAIPDPEQIEELWHADHEELAFDYIQLTVEEVKDLAREELPPDDELAAWLDDQPDEMREDLKTPERRRGEYVFFRDAETTPATGLLEEYPEPEDPADERTPDQLAEDYYNRTYFYRFKKKAPEGEEVPLGAQQFLSLEEVRDQVTAEAPIFFALQRWLTDLQRRQTAEEEIDLAAEAERLGLEYLELESSVTREELAEEEFVADDGAQDTLVNALFQTPEGAFVYSPIITGTRLGLARALSVEERSLPPFEEIRDQVAEAWVEQRAAELAEEKLQELWESLEEFTPETEEDDPEPDPTLRRRIDEAGFQALAEKHGYTLGRRDYVDKGGSVNDDPDWEKDPNKFIATHPEVYFGLELDEVAPPRMARSGEAFYLVRMAGKREVPVERMSPPEYENYKSRARAFALGEVGETLDFETLANQYGIWLANEGDDEEDEEDEDGASG